MTDQAADQLRTGEAARPAPGAPTFATDDHLAREVRTANEQLAQVENGLLNLAATIPSLARAIATVRSILTTVASHLEGPWVEARPSRKLQRRLPRARAGDRRSLGSAGATW